MEIEKALERDNNARVSELIKLKQHCLVGRGFLSEELLKEDEKLTSFYTSLPSYGVFRSVFNLVENKPIDTSAKLNKFQCFLLTLMKLRLNLAK